MFCIFKGDKNGLDDKGRTFKEAAAKHIKWCMGAINKPTIDSDGDVMNRSFANDELKEYYCKATEVFGD